MQSRECAVRVTGRQIGTNWWYSFISRQTCRYYTSTATLPQSNTLRNRMANSVFRNLGENQHIRWFKEENHFCKIRRYNGIKISIKFHKISKAVDAQDTSLKIHCLTNHFVLIYPLAIQKPFHHNGEVMCPEGSEMSPATVTNPLTAYGATLFCLLTSLGWSGNPAQSTSSCELGEAFQN
ncbi:hypothetical protein ACJJTC_010162 [Scirpophaga incertulas]